MQSLRVLIVEDNVDDADLLLRQLKKAEFDVAFTRVETAEQVRTALKEPWDVILSDYGMRDFTGLEALEILQESGLDIPFIIISGSIGEEVAASLMRHGVSDYLMKDNMSRLVPAIQREMQEAENRREKREAEKLLAHSEQRLKLALNAAGLGAWERDLLTHDVFWSPETSAILGITVGGARLEGLHWQILEEDRERVQQRYDEGIRSRAQITVRFRIKRRDGEVIWVSESAQCEYDDRGNPLRLVGTIRDITRDKLAEDALIEAEERYRVMAETASDVVISIDEHSTILYANPAVTAVFGYDPAELKGQPLTMLMPESIRPQHEGGISRYLKTGTKTLDWRRTETTGLRKDGVEIAIQISFGHYSKGNKHYFTGFIRDITESKAAEVAVRESEQNFRALVQATTKFVWQLDERGNLTEHPYWWEELTGQSYAESRDYGWVQYVHPDDRARIKEFYVTAAQSGGAVSTELRIRTQSGEYRHYAASGVPLPTDLGNRWICALSDITAQRTAEERYRIVTEISTDYLFSATVLPNGDVDTDWVAGAFERITGYDWPTFRSRGGWRAIVHPDDLHIDKRDFDLLDAKGPVESEVRIIRKGGDIIWVRVYAHPLSDSQTDQLTGICGAVKDINEKKLAELEVKETAERLRAILNTEPECVKVLSRDGEILDINPAGVRILEADSVEDVLGRNADQVLVPEYVAGFKDTLTHAMAGESVEFGYQINGLKGARRWLEMHAVPLRDASGEITSVLGVSRDITEKRNADELLKKSEMRYADLINSVEGIVWEADVASFCFTFVSRQAEAILGYPINDWLAPGFWQDHIHPEDRDWAVNYCVTATKEGLPHTFEYRMIAADGSVVWMRDIVTVVMENGTPTTLRGIMVDVTEQRRKDAALQRQAMLIEQANEAIFTWDMESGIVEWNQGCEKLYGYTREEVLGRFGFEILQSKLPFTREAFIEHLRMEREWRGEVTQIAKDGRIVYADAQFQVIDFDGRNVVLQTNRDMTANRLAELALRQSETRYRHLFENSPYPMFVYDVESLKFMAVNDAAVYRYGYSIDDFLSMTILDIRPAEDVPKTLARARSRLRKLDSTGDWRHLRVDGSIINVEITSHALEWEGKPARLVLAHDVSDRLRAEGALKESEAKYRELFENANDIIYTHTLDGKFTSLNRTGERIMGYTEAEALDQNISEVMAPEFLEKASRMIKAKLDGSPPTIYETEVIAKDGRRVPLEINTRLILEDGKPIGIQGIGRDTTERRKAAEELRKQRERLDKTAEATPVVICSLRRSADGTITMPFASPAALNVFGLSPTDLEASADQYLSRIHVDDRDSIERALNESAANMSPVHSVYRYEHPSRGEIWIEVHSSPSEERDGSITWHGIAADITEQRLAAEALANSEEQLRQAQKLESIGILAGGMAHDFNNMLTAINGYSDLILRKIDAEDPIRRNVEEIRKAGERSADLTRQLLAFSRRQILQPKVLSLNEVIEDTASLVQRLIGEDIQISQRLDPALWSIQADPGQLSQVLMNLAINSRDAMPDGGSLFIETSNVTLDDEYATRHIDVNPGRYVMLAISDTGVGMDEETTRRVFEPFFTTKTVGRGTGLGLSTVYGIVRQSGGNIWVYSEIGRGTTFKVYLPEARAENAAEEVFDNHREVQLGTETILLVEDEEAVRGLAKEILEACGYKVIEAGDGYEAIERFEATDHIDLLMTDVVMPRMGGRELSENIRKRCTSVKVLFTSGYTDDAVLRHGITDEGTNFLQKPFTFESLSKKVRSLLDSE